MQQINIKYLLFIIPLIIRNVQGSNRYPYQMPDEKQDCFRIGDNPNSDAVCTKYNGYYLPYTTAYSDYTSFSSWVRYQIIDVTNSINSLLAEAKCTEDGSSLPNREEIACSYAVLQSLNKNSCSQNPTTKPTYVCQEKCEEYASSLYGLCSSGNLSMIGYNEIKSACGSFPKCSNAVINNNSSSTGTDSKNVGTTTPQDTTTNTNPIVNGNSMTTVNDNTSGNNSSVPSLTQDNVTNGSGNNNSNGSSANGSGNTSGNNSSVMIDGNTQSADTEAGNDSSNNNSIFYTLGLMMPLGLFITIGVFYYRKKFNKPLDYEKDTYGTSSNYSYSMNNMSSRFSTNFSSNYPSSNTNTHEISSNSNTSHRVFSIGLTNPKDLQLSIPITSNTLNTKQLDTMASTTVAELISTATKLNAVNNVNKNITQPIDPNEVNININTNNPFETTLSIKYTNTAALNNSLPTATTTTTTTRNNLSLHNSSLPNAQILQQQQQKQHINSLPVVASQYQYGNPNSATATMTTTTTTFTLSANPFDPSLSLPNSQSSSQENINFSGGYYPKKPNTSSLNNQGYSDMPGLQSDYSDNSNVSRIKATNSFYHSSVSSESKKFKSFVAPMSPIVGECEERSLSGEEEISSAAVVREGGENSYRNRSMGSNQPTTKFLTDSILEENRNMNPEDNDYYDDDDDNDCTVKLTKNNTTFDLSNYDASMNNNNMSYSIFSNDGKDKSKLSKYASARIPLSVMIVIQAFEPRMEDELCLSIDDRILLLKVFDDGWGVGLNQMTGKQGVFPMEYVVSSELIKSNNKFASQIEYRYELPNRTVSMAFSNYSFTNTSVNDSVIHFNEEDEESSLLNIQQKSNLRISSVINPQS